MKDQLITLEDWNAVVGEGEESNITGRFGLGIINGKDQRIIYKNVKAIQHGSQGSAQ